MARLWQLALVPLAIAMVADVLIAAVFAAGTLWYDARLGLLPGFSINQYLAILGGVVVVFVVRERRWAWFLEEYPALVLITAVVLGATALYSPATEYAWRKWSQFIGFGLLGVAWTWRCRNRSGGVWGPLLILGGVGILLGLGGVLQYVRSGWSDRMSLMGGGPIVFARWVSTGVLVYGCWMLARGRAWLPLLGPLLVPLGIAMIFVLLLAGSKGPVLGFVGGAIYLANGLLAAWSLPRRLLLGVTALAVLAVVAYLLEPTIFVRFALDPFAATSQGSWGARAGWLADAIRLIDEQPWYGSGLGGWAMLEFHQDGKIYPHNLVAELLVEIGPVAGTALIVVWVWRVVVWWRRAAGRGDGSGLALRGLLICWTVNVMFSGDLTDSRILILLAGFLWATAGPDQSDRADSAIRSTMSA